MERFNSFNIIHKGLRAALYQTALQLQQTDFNEEGPAGEALDKVREIIMLFEGHAHKEDHFVLPMINEYEPSVVATFNAEHVEDERLGKELKNAADLLAACETPSEKASAGRALSESFVRFMVFNLEHMAKEEEIINKILWRYYSDDEIKAVTAQISKQDPPWIQEFYTTWMIRGINNDEAIGWMKAIERGVPPIAFQSLLQKAEKELPVNRYQKITRSLSEGIQLA